MTGWIGRRASGATSAAEFRGAATFARTANDRRTKLWEEDLRWAQLTFADFTAS